MLKLKIIILFLVSGLAGLSGCRAIEDEGMYCPANMVIYEGFDRPPRLRFGSYPSSTLATNFLDPDIGTHGYYFTCLEKNGILYTLRGGHIDTAHVRIAADWTSYLTARTYRCVMENKSSFSFKLGADLSRHYITITYPDYWARLSRQRRSTIAKDVALSLGPYLAFEAITWHEILTWYGFKCMRIYTEFPSAFSWEDSYSNILGIRIAVSTLRDAEHTYNEAVTIAFDRELDKLGVQSADFAKRATDLKKGEWFTGGGLFFVSIKKRNFDVGLDDGYVTPTLIDGLPGCGGIGAISYKTPDLEVPAAYGFSIKVETEPTEWEKDKIFRVVFNGPQRDNPASGTETRSNRSHRRIELAAHLARIMDSIEREALSKYGYKVQSHISNYSQIHAD